VAWADAISRQNTRDNKFSREIKIWNCEKEREAEPDGKWGLISFVSASERLKERQRENR
jgi:hypothetical protein